MDPNEAWRQILALSKKLAEHPETADTDEVGELAELVLSFDEWVSRGGFLPDVFLQKK